MTTTVPVILSEAQAESKDLRTVILLGRTYVQRSLDSLCSLGMTTFSAYFPPWRYFRSQSRSKSLLPISMGQP